jgi:hypothetical protein
VDAGEDRVDDLVPQGEQGGDGAGSGGRDLVAAGAAGLGDEALPAELSQVVSGLAGGVAVVAGHRLDPGCVLGNGEAMRRGGQGQCGRQGGADPGFVQVDAADPGDADPGGQRQLIEGLVVEEAGTRAR